MYVSVVTIPYVTLHYMGSSPRTIETHYKVLNTSIVLIKVFSRVLGRLIGRVLVILLFRLLV